MVTQFHPNGQPMTPLIPATPDFTNVPVTPMDALLTMDEVLGEILAFTTTSTTTMGAAWSPSDSVWVASRDLQAFTTSTTSTTPGANDQEEHEEEIPDYLEVEVEETKDMELQDGEAVPGGELDDGYGVGSMALELTEREELLARHIATLVVAEMYHLLRSTGVVAGPAVPGGHVDVRVTMFVLLRHGAFAGVCQVVGPREPHTPRLLLRILIVPHGRSVTHGMISECGAVYGVNSLLFAKHTPGVSWPGRLATRVVQDSLIYYQSECLAPSRCGSC